MQKAPRHTEATRRALGSVCVIHFISCGVLAHLPDAGTARDHQRIDLMRPDAVDWRGVHHHPDVGRHQPARGREIGQGIARGRQFDLLQFRKHLRWTGNVEQGDAGKGEHGDPPRGRFPAQFGPPGFGSFRGHIVL